MDNISTTKNTSYVYAMLKALQGNQNSLENMQIVDAKSTEAQAAIETSMYEHWNSLLADDAQKVYDASTDSSKDSQEKVPGLQAKYNEASSEAQSNQSQQDGVVQSGQQQTSADASNLQMMVQSVQALNGILSALSGMLGRITA